MPIPECKVPTTTKALPKHLDDTAPLGPNQIVRLQDGWKYFGLKQTQIDEKIQGGEIPAPIKLSTSGRGRGWLGSQIIQWQAERLAEPRPNRAPRSKSANV